MPKAKVDPIVSVLSYFEHATLEVAELALTLAKSVVAKRRGPSVVAKGKPGPKKKKEVDVPLPGMQSTVGG